MSSFTPLAITLRYHYTLCAFVCKIKYFDAQIRDNLLYKYSRSFDLLACLGEYATKCLQGNKTRKQLAFLIIFLCIQILHKFQATLCGRINLLVPFMISMGLLTFFKGRATHEEGVPLTRLLWTHEWHMCMWNLRAWINIGAKTFIKLIIKLSCHQRHLLTWGTWGHCEEAMNRKNTLLLTNEPVEFEEWPVEVQELQDMVMNWQWTLWWIGKLTLWNTAEALAPTWSRHGAQVFDDNMTLTTLGMMTTSYLTSF